MLAHDGQSTIERVKIGLAGAIAMVAIAGLVLGGSISLPIEIASAVLGFVVGALLAIN
jgi:hypothetical protein